MKAIQQILPMDNEIEEEKFMREIEEIVDSIRSTPIARDQYGKRIKKHLVNVLGGVR